MKTRTPLGKYRNAIIESTATSFPHASVLLPLMSRVAAADYYCPGISRKICTALIYMLGVTWKGRGRDTCGIFLYFIFRVARYSIKAVNIYWSQRR